MNDALAPKPGIALSQDQKLEWLRLIRSENVGPATFVDLINHFGSASAALDALPEMAQRGQPGKTIRIASVGQAEAEMEKIDRLKARLVCLGEPGYPPALRSSDGAPPLLTVLGSEDILTQTTIAFVGSRNASLSGIKFTRELASAVGDKGYATVSGLARGIDSAAHEASLSTGTVAVFAGGIDHIYPRENASLVSAIVENGGAVVSEMPFGWTPRAQDFPRRNRIVAGIALGLVVVEAARRSGSLISARLANEMGRLVFAVPGSPLDPRSDGANHLIKQGAQLITSAQDIIDAIAPIAEEPTQSGYSLDEEGKDTSDIDAPSESDREKLISAIGHAPTDVDELMRFTQLGAGTLQMLLLELDLAGKLERHSGNRVSLV